ncbi:MAG: SIMPL domain-containing protein [Proteobacteria bacterium]|nr:SIMPL domain-containing protein [Pseudomonadota bacterium]
MKFNKFNYIVFFSIFVASQVLAQDDNQSALTEISATAYEKYYQAPDSVSFNINLEQTGANSVDILTSIDEKTNKLIQNLKNITPNVLISSRGDKFTPASQTSNNRIKLTTPFSVSRTLRVETNDLTKLSKLFDNSLQSGQTSISNLIFSVKDSQKGLVEAVAKASIKAKEKAEQIAKTLNVNLGSLISADSTEEPNGEMLREKLQEGEDIVSYGDIELNVSVTVKYSIR